MKKPKAYTGKPMKGYYLAKLIRTRGGKP